MFKLMWLMKRKAGTSPQEFQEYYEKHHALLGLRIWEQMGMFPKKYVRRYLQQPDFLLPEGGASAALSPSFDVATEMWFDSREDFETFMRSVPQPAISLIEEDERKFLDREKSMAFLVEEQETDLRSTQTERV